MAEDRRSRQVSCRDEALTVSNGVHHRTASPNSHINESVRNAAKKCLAAKSDWVKLNVGGTCFLTTRTTLSKDRNSLLYMLINEEVRCSVSDGKVLNKIN